MDDRTKRRLGVGVVAALGVALLLVHVYAAYEDLVVEGDSALAVFLEVAMPVALAVAVLGLADWLRTSDWDGPAVLRVARWASAGLLGMGLVLGVEVGSQWALGDDIEQWMVAASAATALTLVGGIAGVERVRQRHQREEVERSAARYESLTEDVLDTSSVGTFILDDEFRVVWMNEATETYFGLDREDVVGRPKRELIESTLAERVEEPERFRERLFAAYDDNTYTEEFECHVRPGEGRAERWLDHWSKPIGSGLYAGGRIEHYTDVTEQKRTERELSRREAQLRDINEVVSRTDLDFEAKLQRLLGTCRDALDTDYAGIIRVGDDEADFEVVHAPEAGVKPGTALRLSDAAAERLLSTRDTVQGESVQTGLPWGVLAAETGPEVGGYAAAPVAGEEDFYGVVYLFDTDAREEPFAEWQLALLELTADFIGTEMDRVRRVERRERELREQRQKFSALVEDVEEYAIFTLDPDGTVTTWNRGAERIKGYEADDIVGENFRQFYPEADRQGGKPERLLETAAEEGRVEDEGWRVREDGGRFWADVVITALTGDDGDLRGYVKIVRDMTDRRERERRLQVLYRVLRHNLRNEMTVIGGHADQLLAELDEESDLRELAEKIRETAHDVGRFSDRVEDVEETIEADREARRRELADLIGQVVERSVEASPDVDLDTEVPAGVNPRVDERLETALSHLVENAIEHTEGRPTVRLRVERERTPAGEWLRIVVDDDGPGIPDQERETIEEGTVTALQHGSGLGLWVSKWIVESLGGELCFGESDLGGTAVVLRVPEQ